MLRYFKGRFRPVSREDPTRNPRSREFEIDNWIVSEFVLNRLVPVVGVRPFPLNELMLMVGVVCRCKPTHIFEWGTHLGASARVFRETVAHFEFKTQIHSIDLPDDADHVEHPRHARGVLVKGLPGVSLHQGDGVTVALALCHTLAPFRPLFFLDGDHAYSSVKRELDAIITAIERPVILVHDTFVQSADAGYNLGPHDAIREVLITDPGRFKRLDTATGLPGMTFLNPL